MVIFLLLFNLIYISEN